tara:strand:+ start:225 stop:386 length:162 start_codon:yes stop_codon:yes gene_type:complete
MGHTPKPIIIRSRITTEADKELTRFIHKHPTLHTVSATIRYALEKLMRERKRK